MEGRLVSKLTKQVQKIILNIQLLGLSGFIRVIKNWVLCNLKYQVRSIYEGQVTEFPEAILENKLILNKF